jgi:hypothetical protein
MYCIGFVLYRCLLRASSSSPSSSSSHVVDDSKDEAHQSRMILDERMRDFVARIIKANIAEFGIISTAGFSLTTQGGMQNVLLAQLAVGNNNILCYTIAVTEESLHYLFFIVGIGG